MAASRTSIYYCNLSIDAYHGLSTTTDGWSWTYSGDTTSEGTGAGIWIQSPFPSDKYPTAHYATGRLVGKQFPF